MKDVKILIEKWNSGTLSFEEQNVIKDKLRYVQTRCDWIKNQEQKIVKSKQEFNPNQNFTIVFKDGEQIIK